MYTSAPDYSPLSAQALLPAGASVFERGWLSSNNLLLCGRYGNALIDSGYASHATQTQALVKAALAGKTLDYLLNTHLHSDHCGGNAALQQAYPALHTLIAPGQAAHVQHWSSQALGYDATGQYCPEFRCDALLQPGTEMGLGDALWQVHAAPGHDPEAVILFEPQAHLLVSGDALWQRGFGVVFPELEGQAAFETLGQTLDLIEALNPAVVIPGHGPVFSDLAPALHYARERLNRFVRHPEQHIEYATKVLLKFKLLEVQQIELAAFTDWAAATPYAVLIHRTHAPTLAFADWMASLVEQLIASGAASRSGTLLCNASR